MPDDDFHSRTLVNIMLHRGHLEAAFGHMNQCGKRVRPEATLLFDRIPDGGFGLFARIEFTVALARLPELPEIQLKQRRPPDGFNRNRER